MALGTAYNPFSLTGKRILVTGASSGLGHAIATSCARMGALIVATGRDSARLAQTMDDLRGISDLEHRSVVADLTIAEQRDEVAGSAGQLNGLVHSAGISRLCPTRMLSEAHIREVTSINIEAPMLLTQGLLKRNLIAPDGSILFLASIAAHIGVPGVGVYSGTKAAIIAMARCLALEVVKRRIRVNCLSPSLVTTPLFDEAAKSVGGESITRQENNHPLGFGQASDVANAAIYMLSDASRWVTGTTLVMDGGLTIG